MVLRRSPYRPLNADRREIRVASLLPGRWSDEISCTLSTVSLDEEPAFEALSYTWGDPKDTVSIYLDNFVFQATRNLQSALRRLRSSSKPVTIWIDAVCINQADIPERGQQVSMMQDIYSKAKEVKIYLGESPVLEAISEEEQSSWEDPPRTSWYDDHETKLTKFHDQQLLPVNEDTFNCEADRLRGADLGAFAILCLLASARCLRNCMFADHNNFTWKQALISLDYLMRRPWWSRAWVIQETILARNSTVIYGETVAPLDMVERGASLISVHIMRCCREFFNNLPIGHQELLQTADKHGAALEGIRHDYESFKVSQADQLQRFLYMTRLRQASDGRDKVYSLLGLIQHQPDPIGFVPDYSLRLSQVYARTGLQLIRHFNNLDILMTHERKDPKSEIPSWAPDWRSSKNNEDGDLWIHAHMSEFNAGPAQGDVADLIADYVLSLKGIEIDSVSSVTTPLSQDVANTADRIDEYLALLSVGPDSAYVRGGTVRDAFFRTMINDMITNNPNVYRRATASDEISFDNWWIAKQGQRQGRQVYLRRGEEMLPVEESPEFIEVNRSFWLANDERSFFVTRGGYMGFGPPDMEAGDSVFVGLGSKVPLVLRKARRPDLKGIPEHEGSEMFYSLVGYCYLHGIMDGEGVGARPVDVRPILLL